MSDLWTFDANGYLIANCIEKCKIHHITSSHKMGMVKVVLDIGKELTLELKTFDATNHKGFEKLCRNSRSAFLDWIKECNEHVFTSKHSDEKIDSSSEDVGNSTQHGQGRAEEEGSAENGNTETVFTSKHSDEKIDSSSEDVGNSTQHGQGRAEEEGSAENDDTETLNVLEFQLDNRNFEDKIIGRNVSIPIKNLIEPSQERKVRDIDERHVMELEHQFSSTPHIYTILVGNVNLPGSVSIENLQTEGFPNIEVLGGNHTRQALQNLQSRKEGTISTVRMDIYQNLTSVEAMILGVLHNAQHEHSRSTSFTELTKLFRKLLSQSKEKYPDSERQCAIHWRSQVSLVMGIEKQKVKNSFQTHLYCASLDQTLWDLFNKFCIAWRDNRIKNKPKGDIKQTHIIPWCKCDDQEKRKVIEPVIRGDINFDQFKKNCTSIKKNRTPKTKITGNEKKTENGCKRKKTSAETKTDGVETERGEIVVQQSSSATQTDITVNNEKELLLKMEVKKLKIECKRLTEEVAHEKEVNMDVKNEIESLKNEMKEAKKWSSCWEEKYRTVKSRNGEMHIKINELKDALQFAEEAAARARKEMMNPCQEKEIVVTAQQQPNAIQDENVSEGLHVQHDKRTGDLAERAETSRSNKGKKRKITEMTEIVSQAAPPSKDVPVGLVQYNAGKIYFGVFETADTFVYCKAPAVSVNSTERTFEFNENPKSKELNMRDCQLVADKDIILKFEGRLGAKNTVLMEKNPEVLRAAITKHLEF